MLSTTLVLVGTLLLWNAVRATEETTLTVTALERLIADLRGDDTRMVRWDATAHTVQRQQPPAPSSSSSNEEETQDGDTASVGGACLALPQALELIVTTTATTKDDKLAALACEYATFCITDNPTHRNFFANFGKDIHAAVVKLVSSPNSQASALASHLIYIATFANHVNHEGFYVAGAVEALGKIIKDGAQTTAHKKDGVVVPPTPYQIMWAAAALQNLAASYCATEDDGRCYWFWPETHETLALTEASGKVLSSGAVVRDEILEDTALVEALIHFTCQGPVRGEMSDDNPFPGDNASVEKHQLSPNIIPWAAAGALKSVALEPEARAALEPAMPCFCQLAHSPDWLEENKGEGAVAYMRRDDPCWFTRDEEIHLVCVDGYFHDEEGYTCSDYGAATDDDCKTIDRNDVRASDACCECGGGHSKRITPVNDEL